MITIYASIWIINVTSVPSYHFSIQLQLKLQSNCITEGNTAFQPRT